MTTPAASAVTPVKPVTITFHDRVMEVVAVSQEQLALLIEAQEWFRRRRRALDAMADAGATSDPEQEKILQQGFKHVGRLQSILANLFADQEDWDFICDGMADRTIPWTEVADLPAQILAAHRLASEGEPGNRADKRAAAKRGRRAT